MLHGFALSRHQIRHETLRISVIQRLEAHLKLHAHQNPDEPPGNGSKEVTLDPDDEVVVPFEPFKDLCKRRFLWYYQSYLTAVQQGILETQNNQEFALMPFESGNNGMTGRFNYPDLERRLHRIKAALDLELKTWAEEGLAETFRESTVAVNLQHQFDQSVASFKRSDLPHDLSLENRNPFVWVITYFGRPMTSLDGGLLRIKMHFSPRFPEEQPRVRLASKIFHHHVAPDGTFCYSPRPAKAEDVKAHIEAIICNLEEEEPAYDPRRIVNPEASKLYWSTNRDEKKQYNRRLRRSVQESVE